VYARLCENSVIPGLTRNPRGKFAGQEPVSKSRITEYASLNGIFTQPDAPLLSCLYIDFIVIPIFWDCSRSAKGEGK
jgi:hypothetical protein